ncbi:hypothetical protein SAMN02745166_05055 [Prosthecobacter debontii]|uniref:Uncharacterized protein n=1 Tax=Prosthecobacter debontii TaxID=48467 RepID=A0A1T4Z4S2_9BACT|nr:hypothetical protein [Prosthecobacter debontii]SKB08936.1 hypothetical protein SAMN02745166_05055 [Prosthecobacter debontii]
MNVRLLISALVSCLWMPAMAQLVVTKFPAKDTSPLPWQADMDQLERRYVKSLLPVQQILLSELEVQRKSPSGLSAQRQVDLSILQSTAEERQQALSQGKIWLPGPQQAGWEAFCRAAQGRTWSLEGTSNVRKLRIEGQDLMLTNDKGMEFRPTQQRAAALPGAFLTRRSDRGYSVYLISPDLQQARCLVVRSTSEGISRSASMPLYLNHSPAEILATLDATPQPDPKPSTRPPDLNQDLLTALEDRVRQIEVAHHREAIQILTKHVSQSYETRAYSNMFPLKRILRQYRRALAYLTRSPELDVPMLSQERFLKEVPEERWLLSGRTSGGHPWSQFDGQFLHALNFKDEEGAKEPMQIIWPGLISNSSHPSDRPCYIAFSADFHNCLYLPNVTGTYRGKLLE